MVRKSARISAVYLVVLLVLWLVFAPSQLGGQVSYVIIDGTSMLPFFEPGDLVLVRQSESYQIGDIVTYRYPGLGSVIHRIVERQGERYVLQGDNNRWEDGYQPVREEIIGKYWLDVPGAGKWIGYLRSPVGLGLLAAVLFFIIGGPMIQKRAKAQSGRVKRQVNRFALQFGRQISGWQEAYFVIMYVLVLGSLFLGAFAFTRPVQRNEAVEIPYRQRGFYTYGASLGGDLPVYDNNQLGSGDAIFPRLNCSILLSFAYVLEGPRDVQAGGSYHLTAEVSDRKGWHRSVELAPVTTFQGGTFQVAKPLDFCQIQQMIDQAEQATGTTNNSYQVRVSPQVAVAGTLNGQAFADQFNAPLVFEMDANQVFLAGGAGEGDSLLQPSQAGLAQGQAVVENSLPLFTLLLPVGAARVIAGVGFVLGLAGLALAEVAFHQAQRADPLLHTRLVANQPLFRVHGPALTARSSTELSSLKDLIELGGRLGCPILFTEDEEGLCYYLCDRNMLFYFRQPVSGGEDGDMQDQTAKMEQVA